jgi:hypothetical protein
MDTETKHVGTESARDVSLFAAPLNGASGKKRKPAVTPPSAAAPAKEEETPNGGKGRVRAKAPVIPLSMDGVWRTGHVLAATGWSHGTLANRIRDGLWPKPTKEDGRPRGLNGWTTSVCREALRKLGYDV